MKFDTISRRAQDLNSIRKHAAYKGLASRVNEMIDSARINADDSVYTEKTVPITEWDRIATTSLEFLLGCSNDQEVSAWFRKAGFRW